MAKKNKPTHPKQPCKNHPDVLSGRRCYQCKSYVCGQCIIHFDHHFFCSQSCIKIYSNKSMKKAPPAAHPHYLMSKKDIFYITIILFIILLFITRFYKPSSSSDIPVQSVDSLKHTPPVSPWLPSVYQDGFVFNISPAIPDTFALNIWVNNNYFNTLSNTSKISIPVDVLLPGKNDIKLIAVSISGNQIVYSKEITVNPPTYSRLDYLRIPGRAKKIALTFDAGSNSNAVDSITHILKKYQVPGTAFLTGGFIKQYPDIVRDLVASNLYSFGNHSYSHPHLTTYAENNLHQTLPDVEFKTIKDELLKTDSLFYLTTGNHMQKLWRAPYGEYNQEILNWAGHLGYSHVSWSKGFDTFDWVKDTTSTIYYTPAEMWEKWQSRWEKSPAQFKGAIVLMHLGNDRIKPMYKFLHRFIPFMKTQGYRFVDITNLK